MGKNIAVLASGVGTNAEHIIRFFQSSSLARVVLVLCNRPSAGVLKRAQLLGVDNLFIPSHEWIEGERILALLQQYQIDFIVLAGFLMRVPDVLLEAYPCRIVNIHPALLPKFGGKGMYGIHVHEEVLAAGESESGITIHYITARYDEGDIVFQASCPVFPADTPEVLANRVHALEYLHYPAVIARLIEALPD